MALWLHQHGYKPAKRKRGGATDGIGALLRMASPGGL